MSIYYLRYEIMVPRKTLFRKQCDYRIGIENWLSDLLTRPLRSNSCPGMAQKLLSDPHGDDGEDDEDRRRCATRRELGERNADGMFTEREGGGDDDGSFLPLPRLQVSHRHAEHLCFAQQVGARAPRVLSRVGEDSGI